MAVVASNLNQQQNYFEGMTYQHVQGCMLNRLFDLDLPLSHTEHRVMTAIMKYWNMKSLKAFPSINKLCIKCRMSKPTVLKALKGLVKYSLLIILKTERKRNQYFISNLLLPEAKNLTQTSTKNLTSSGKNFLPHDKHTEHEQIEQTSYTNVVGTHNDDVSFKNTDNVEFMQDHKEIISKLQQWQVSDIRRLIKINGIAKIKQCIKITEESEQIKNPGAYFRKLLEIYRYQVTIPPVKNNLGPKVSGQSNTLQKEPANPLKNNSLEHCKKIQQINDPRPSKQEIIQQLLNEGKTEEAQSLMTLWRMEKSNYAVIAR